MNKPVKISLPEERRGVTRRFVLGSEGQALKGYVTVNVDSAGRPVELFIRMTRPGTVERGLLEAVGRLASTCLQYGVPPAVLVGQLAHTRFEPDGWVEGKYYSSVLDRIFQWFGERFVAGSV